MTKKFIYRITVIESERGWGQKQEYWDYDTPEKAQEAINSLLENNKKNWEKTHVVPDWYMQPEGGIQAIEVDV